MAATDAHVIEQLAAALGAEARRETHGSWVLLTRDRAYKVKKPLVLDFLDYGSLSRRHAMCRAEVELNRRAAPAIYLGVRAIVPSAGGVALAGEGAPGAIEYAVEMLRFDEGATFAAALERGDATAETAADVGRAVAGFHARCEVVRDAAGAEPVRRSLDDNHATLATLLAGDPAALRRLALSQRFAATFLAARGSDLDARAAQGKVLDGHGDLRAEHVLLGEEIQLVDAIEFSPALRRIDVGTDLAFLVMDLHASDRADLADELLRAYRDAGGDPGDDELVAFFAAYRAQVRAKVALIRAGQGADAGAAACRREAVRLLAVAERLQWRARGPLIIAVAGVSASGKSTLAQRLAADCGLGQISSDVVRKRIRGLRSTQRAPATAYSAAAGLDTYRELGRLAAREPHGAIVDATFRRRSERDAFRDALGAATARLQFVECRVPREVLEARARERLDDPRRVSDATPSIALAQLAEFEPLDEVPPDAHLLLRADREPARLTEEVADRICGSPERTSEVSTGDAPQRLPMPRRRTAGRVGT